MEQKEIIRRFSEERKKDPQKFYSALGYKVNIMDEFYGDSYSLGLIVGALYALEHFAYGHEKRAAT